MQDLKFIAELNELERAELDQLMPHPELWLFLQGDTAATLEQREQVAIQMHRSNDSNPPWFEVGRVVNLDDHEWLHKVRTMADQLHERNRVHVSEAEHYEREMRAQASEALYKKRVDRNDVTHISKEADTTKRNSIPEVKQSNRFTPLADMVDKAAAKSSASVTYTCDKTHCTGGHFVGKSARKEYAKHIQERHRGELTESERNLGLLQCKTCGKVTYTGETAAKKHQDGCVAQTPEVQARRRKEIEKSHTVGSTAAGTKRKWQPHSSKRQYTRRAVDLTDTMTDAQIDAFFGPLDLNAANSRFTGNSGKTIRKIPRGAQHAWATVNEAAARRVLSNRGKPEYARLLMSLPMACLMPPTKAEKAAKITLTDKILTNISKVLRGDFSSFDDVPDERVRVPQAPPGVITKEVAQRIATAVRENCISIAVRMVEGDGLMAGTPEVAAKLQEMYPTSAPGFAYDFSRQLAATFKPDAELGPASSYSGAMASTVYEISKLWKRYMDAAKRAGRMKASGGTGWTNENVRDALLHSRKIMPLLMAEIENDNMCSELRQFFANVKVATLNKPDKQDPTAPPKDFRPIGSGEPLHKISQNPMAREMNAHFAPRLADLGQFGLSPNGITFAGILPAIILEMPKFKNAALGLADVTSAFQLISRKALWKVLCALEDGQIKVKLQRKFLALYSGTNFGYYLLADGTTLVVSIREGVTQGCNFGTLLFNLGYAMLVLKPLQEEFKEKQVIAICIHDDSAHLGEASHVCEMMTRTMALGKENLALRYGEAKKQLYQSERTGDQASNDTDVDKIRLRYEGTEHLPAGVNRSHLKFAGIFIGKEDKVSAALENSVAGSRSKLLNRMVPFLNSPLVKLQNKLCILQYAAGERTLDGHVARGQSKAQTEKAFELAKITFNVTYEKLLQQPAGTFNPGQPGWHREQSELPRHLGGFNLPTLVTVQEPAAAGAMVGIIGYLAQCKLLGAEERDPQQWFKCESARLRDTSSSIKALLDSPYFHYMNTPKTAEMYWTLVDPPIDGESNSRPKANFQKISDCRSQNTQMLFSLIRFTEIKAALMDDPNVSPSVKHRFQVASQPGSGKASMVVPTEKCLEMDDDAALQAVCCRLGLPIPGLHMRTRCLSNCTQMGPHAALTENTVRESILTGTHFLGCKCCGTYDRHNEVTQVAFTLFKTELKYSGSTGSFDSNYVGISAKGSSKHTDGQVWGSAQYPGRVAFDMSIVNPTAVSHSGAAACAESFLNPNAGTRKAEQTKTDKYGLLCRQLGMDFVPIIFTTSGGMGEQFQRRYWNPHWIRVAEEDAAMKIGPWVARKRKAFWEARFAVAVANCNARMISRSQHITD